MVRVRMTVSGVGILICWLEALGRKKVSWNGVRMVTRLKLALGDRKIDVIGDYEDNAVVQEALLHGIRLI